MNLKLSLQPETDADGRVHYARDYGAYGLVFLVLSAGPLVLYLMEGGAEMLAGLSWLLLGTLFMLLTTAAHCFVSRKKLVFDPKMKTVELLRVGLFRRRHAEFQYEEAETLVAPARIPGKKRDWKGFALLVRAGGNTILLSRQGYRPCPSSRQGICRLDRHAMGKIRRNMHVVHLRLLISHAP